MNPCECANNTGARSFASTHRRRVAPCLSLSLFLSFVFRFLSVCVDTMLRRCTSEETDSNLPPLFFQVWPGKREILRGVLFFANRCSMAE